MMLSRRSFLKGVGGSVALPILESNGATLSAVDRSPLRLLVVGNPFGAHPNHFFPKEFGKDSPLSQTLRPLNWLKERLTVVSGTDHNMVSGHGREISFLSGVLPTQTAAFPEKNMSLDQLVARNSGDSVRFDSVGAALGSSIRMSWTANGVEKLPFVDPGKLFDHLFLNLTPVERARRAEILTRDRSILDTVGEQFKALMKKAGSPDRDRLDQFQTSLREMEKVLSGRRNWLKKDKPHFEYSDKDGDGIEAGYDAIFDMLGYAFQTDLTRVASVEFPASLNYTDIEGVNRSYHGCTHNGKRVDVTAELVAIETFQIARLSRCLRKLDSIKEPFGDGSLLDRTVVLFGSGMGYGGSHSNRNLPIFVAGGGFSHRGHVDATGRNGDSMPLCNLFVTLLQRLGIERDRFNTSTGSFDLDYA